AEVLVPRPSRRRRLFFSCRTFLELGDRQQLVALWSERRADDTCLVVGAAVDGQEVERPGVELLQTVDQAGCVDYTRTECPERTLRDGPVKRPVEGPWGLLRDL